ncbi:MAG: hypothetical protein CMK09_01035 [Ponticaulis sp.]|nr:hypothetical protein [Ponticaulis sp.]|tara:strand:+ start:5168 stop:6637 length:1470 start_codon:yes stop_codon:yes gene_type:complete
MSDKVASWNNWLNDRRGGMLTWFALITPALVSVAALAIDIGRIYALENDLQLAADSYARAAAFELDRQPDAIARASQAANDLLHNDQRFGQGGSSDVTVANLRFLKDIPSSDTADITSDFDTSVSADARYVEITVSPKTISTLLPTDMVSGVLSIELEAKAVAGASRGVCNMAPMFVCNPVEDTGGNLFALGKTRSFQRRQVLLLEKGNGKDSTYFPGNFGYLEVGGSGASDLKDAMSLAKPNNCVSQDGVELRTGAVASVVDGFNTRFDIYEGSYKKESNNPAYAPAENVTRGVSGKACKESADPNAMGLPRDACHLTGTCTDADGRLGDGDWDFPTYLEVNHGAPVSVTINGTNFTINYATRKVSPELPSRYEVYRWEIETNRIPGSVGYGASTTPENGEPACYSGGTAAGVDRRVVRVAVLDCLALDEQYGINGSSAPPLPAKAFWQFFITEPIGSTSDMQIWGEMIGPVTNETDELAVETARVVR